MIGKSEKISLIILLTLVFQHLSYAQYSKPIKDTLEDHFNAKAAQKDGFDFDGRMIDIPTNIVKKYDKKKARIIGTSVGYKVKKNVVDEKGDTIIYQERNNDFMFSYNEKVERKKYWIGTTFKIETILVWDSVKWEWKTIYTKN